jgi:hypothetical protein
LPRFRRCRGGAQSHISPSGRSLSPRTSKHDVWGAKKEREIVNRVLARRLRAAIGENG